MSFEIKGKVIAVLDKKSGGVKIHRLSLELARVCD